MEAFDTYMYRIFHEEGVLKASEEIIRLYEQSPQEERSNPIKAIQDTYKRLYSDKPKVLQSRGERLDVLNNVRGEIHDLFSVKQTKIALGISSGIDAILQYFANILKAADYDTIPVETIQEFCNCSQVNYVVVLHVLAGAVLTAKLSVQITADLLANIAYMLILDLGHYVELGTLEGESEVHKVSDLIVLGSTFFKTA